MKECIWYVLWHRYLNDDPERFGVKITREELINLTADGQQEMFAFRG